MLSLRTLGSVSLVHPEDGGEVGPVLAQLKRFGVLTYLAVATPRGFHRRDTLLTLFWPDKDEKHARNSLSQALSFLRQHLPEDTIETLGSEMVSVGPQKICSDVETFEAAIAEGRWADALELYKGDFLNGLHVSNASGFEEWVDQERTRMRTAAAKAAWSLAHDQIDRGALSEAERTARKALSLESTDEHRVRGFISRVAASGDRGAALAFFDTFCGLLRRELQVEPSESTVELADKIRNGVPVEAEPAEYAMGAPPSESDPVPPAEAGDNRPPKLRHQGPLGPDNPRKRGGGLWRWIIGGVFGLLLLGAGVLAVREVGNSPDGPVYPSAPELGPWRSMGIGGLSTLFSSGDSLLFAGLRDTLYAFDGKGWRPVGLPDSVRLLDLTGEDYKGHLLGIHDRPDRSTYWLLSPSSTELVKADSLPTPPAEMAPEQWWSDGRELVRYGFGAVRLTDAGWEREVLRTAGQLKAPWGSDINHRFAWVYGAGNLTLAYDGIGWEPVTIFPGPDPGELAFRFGKALGDGRSVVMGQQCGETCRPFLLKERSEVGAWELLSIQEGLGIPLAMDSALCPTEGMTLQGAEGPSVEDFYFWGRWSRCDKDTGLPEMVDCPLDHPCVWRVSHGSIQPVADLLGQNVREMVFVGGVYYASMVDGTFWRTAGERWRLVSAFPSIDRVLVAAKGDGWLHFGLGRLSTAGGKIAWREENTGKNTPPLPGSSPGFPVAQLEATDSLVAVLTTGGRVFKTTCMLRESAATSTSEAFSRPVCEAWDSLPAGFPPVKGLALSDTGDLFGVGGGGRILYWSTSGPRLEPLPPEAAGETFWGVALSPDGLPFAVGPSLVIKRDPSGRWSVVRRLPSREPWVGKDFEVAGNGDLILLERLEEPGFDAESILVWDDTGPASDSLPVSRLSWRDPAVPGNGTVVLHRLGDGRLVAGTGFPTDAAVGGYLYVWEPPVREGRFDRMDLPRAMDITDLDDNGEYLYVAGATGILRIHLDSLPYATGPSG